MTNADKIAELIAGFKTCIDADIDKHFAPIQYQFPMIPNAEKLKVGNELLDWARENQDVQPNKLAYAYYINGLASFFTEHHEETLTNANESQKLFDAQHNADGSALCDLIMGATYRTLGNMDLALKALWRSYEQLEKKAIYQQGMLSAAYNVAGIYIEKKNYHEAVPLLEKILERSELWDNQLFIVNALQGLGKIYLARKEFSAAQTMFERALAKAEEVGTPVFIANLLTDLATYNTETGDDAKAIVLHRRALELRTEQKAIGGTITNLMSLAGIYKKDGRTQEAIAMLNDGIKMAEQARLKPKLYQLHQLLSEIYDQMDEPGKSLHHYKLFHEIREQVEREDEAKKIKNLQMVFEAEQTKKENIIIKKQKQEIELKNIELQETIDELTITKVSRRAKALTLLIAVALFVGEDLLLDFVLHKLPADNIMLSLGAKILIVFSLKPIERGIEHNLLKRAIKRKKRAVLV